MAAAVRTAASGKSKDWCFTLNNPLTTDLPHALLDSCTYAVWQLEQAPGTGTRHLQGFVQFHSGRVLGGLKKLIPGAHWEPRKGTPTQARDYCMKAETRLPDGGPFMHGDFNARDNQGARSDIIELRDYIKSGKTKRDLLEDMPEMYAKYARFADECITLYGNDQVDKTDIVDLRPWQSDVMSYYKSHQEKDAGYDRAIYWLYDSVGGAGKTHLAKYLTDHHSAFYCNGGKSADITYGYQREPIVIFDFVRESENYINYGAIEQLKNGILYSSKYNSAGKRFDPPFVVVFANFKPCPGKLSRDRVQLFEIVDHKLEELEY